MQIFILESNAERSAAIHAVAHAPPGTVLTLGDAPSSIAQRKAFWAIMAEIADCLCIGNPPTQHDAETWAEYFLNRYAPRREVNIAGATRWIREPLARMSAIEFSDVLGKLEAEAIEMGMEFHTTRGTLDQFRQVGRRIANITKGAHG